MRRRLVAATIAISALVRLQAAAADIAWQTKLDRAAAAALARNQPMLIEFWATWCEPCQEMDRDVYADERVAAAMRKLQPVRIDIDRETALQRKYGISGTPTLLVTDSYGRELFRYDGTLPLDRMVQLLDALPADVTAINRWSAALAAKPDDFEALAAMGGELRAVGFYRSSSDYYARALRTKEGRRHGASRGAVLVGLQRNALELRLSADAVRYGEAALTEVAGQPEEAAVRRDLERARLGLRK